MELLFPSEALVLLDKLWGRAVVGGSSKGASDLAVTLCETACSLTKSTHRLFLVRWPGIMAATSHLCAVVTGNAVQSPLRARTMGDSGFVHVSKLCVEVAREP